MPPKLPPINTSVKGKDVSPPDSPDINTTAGEVSPETPGAQANRAAAKTGKKTSSRVQTPPGPFVIIEQSSSPFKSQPARPEKGKLQPPPKDSKGKASVGKEKK
jgi:hypothetical protein